MNRRALFGLFLGLLFVGAWALTPGPAEAQGCSGYWCGCDIEYETCISGCPPETDPGYADCARDCRRENILCAKCCCCQCYDCPPACGAFSFSGTVPRADETAAWLTGGLTRADRCAPADSSSDRRCSLEPASAEAAAGDTEVAEARPPVSAGAANEE